MRVVAFLFVLAACAPTQRPRPSLISTAESSQWIRTGRFDEAVQLCRDFARSYPEARCEQIGTSGQGRPLVALSIIRREDAPVILIQAGIHAGEIEGKDAGFRFLRDVLDGKVARGALDAVSIVFIPVLNPDGHERFSPNHRPNQRGPEQMGFRTTGTRLNLNRDFVKADAPETQAVLRLVRTRDPLMLVDLHTTDGAKFEHDISVIVTPVAQRTDGLDEAALAFSGVLQKRLTELGHLPLDFYPSFVDDTNPHSGFAQGEAAPRFSHFYMAARSRLGVLVETHSWRTYRERELSTYHTLQAVLEEATRTAPTWRTVMHASDRADAELHGTDVTLLWQNTPAHRDIAFRGYAYEKRLSELTGGTWLVYDETRPEIWNVPLYDELIPAVTIKAPASGYLIDGGFASVVSPVLDRHGIEYVPVAESSQPVEVFRASAVSYSPPYEGRTRTQVEGAWEAATRTLDRGALFVPIAQPRARLILHLFEPQLPDSLVQWGLFNAVFERKEYIEPYVLETAAREMLANQPGLQAEYDAALARDPELAASTDRKLDWFARRHPAWDERVNLVPVYRTAVDLRRRL